MKFFTKEWVAMFQLFEMPYRFIKDENADNFSEEYFQKLYDDTYSEYITKLKKFIEEECGEEFCHSTETSKYIKYCEIHVKNNKFEFHLLTLNSKELILLWDDVKVIHNFKQ